MSKVKVSAIHHIFEWLHLCRRQEMCPVTFGHIIVNYLRLRGGQRIYHCLCPDTLFVCQKGLVSPLQAACDQQQIRGTLRTKICTVDNVMSKKGWN